MKNIIYILIALVLIGGGLFFFNKKEVVAPSNIEINNDKVAPVGISQSEVAKHNSSASCYTIISAKVYDLTNWINKHPGGKEAILSLCGKDGTVAFQNQHADNQKQQDILITYFIGNLTQ